MLYTLDPLLMTQIFKSLMALILAIVIWLAIIRFTWSLSQNPPKDETVLTTWTTAPSESTHTIQLFYYQEDLDRDDTGNILCNADAVQAVSREIENYSIEQHLKLLLAWPTQAEQEQWFSSEFPLTGLTLEDIDLSDDWLLSLRFDDPDHQTSWWACRVGLLSAQLIKTLETNPDIQEIHIEPVDLFQP